MRSFAFIVNIRSIKQLKKLLTKTKFVPNFILKPFLKNAPPFKAAHIKKIKSIQGKEIGGFIIACPLFNRNQEEEILSKIIEAGRVAEQLGAKIIGLDKYMSSFADKGFNALAKNLKTAVTSGNALTAWSVIESIYRLAKIKKLSLKESTFAVIGADSSAGNLCARKISDYAGSLILLGNNKDKLEQLKETILHLNPIRVITGAIEARIIKEADIIINANRNEPAFDIEELKLNAIVCDISLNEEIVKKAKLRQDITLIRCGLIKLPFPDKFCLNEGLPAGVIPASLAETVLLALEDKFISYSLGENINLDALEEIADISVRHGFEVWAPQAPVF